MHHCSTCAERQYAGYLGLGEEERTVGDRMGSFCVDPLLVLDLHK
jgi:hypothetical protein